MRSLCIGAVALAATAVFLPGHSRACEFPCKWGGSASSTVTQASMSVPASFGGAGGGSSRAIDIARGYLGTNPTGRGRLWCAHFMNMVEKKAGRSGTGSGMARSYASYGRRVSDPRPGDIAVVGRKGGGGHVGYVMGVEGGKVTLISGNYNRKVGIGKYSMSSVVAFVRPQG
ncbi:MAG: TIGR02594 family protein [Pseudomonadota bacterium]|nr:TIGR02594 family protein [Pseudomonadota bacterium]